MKLRKLLKDTDVQVKGSREVEITGISSNSKFVAPGNLFIAKKGLNQNGARFIPEAVAAGAAAILTDIYDPFLDVVQIIHPDVAAIESEIVGYYYKNPSNDLFVVGITGTNGKTTTSYLVKHLLDGLKKPCGLIGTNGTIIGKNYFPSALTTPDIITNQKLLHEMVSMECTAAVMEVSSHALEQNRVKGIAFDVGIFTNLTPEHLDYHPTMEAYAAAKAKLFASTPISVLNADCPWHGQMKGKGKVLTYGIDRAADVQAKGIELSAKGVRFDVYYKEEKLPFNGKLIGRFNVYNYLAVIALGLTQNIPLRTLLEILHTFKSVSGRLEHVSNDKNLTIVVDYAHKPDALKNVLQTLKGIKKGRLLVVFGCGGARDKVKRPKMAEIAESWSDFTIVTTDNPRNEDPETIIKEIVLGFKDPKNYTVEIDRREAIKKGIKMAHKDDILLIAGKGHETYQIFAHQTIDFDDRKIAAELCAQSPSD